MDDLQEPDAAELLRRAAADSREALQSEIGSAQWEAILDRVDRRLDDENERQ